MQHKQLQLNKAEIKMNLETGTFSGYASTFGNVDSYGDTILPGAYAATLSEYGLPKMFFNHDMEELPVGKWLSAVEDQKGLYVTGEFTPDMEDADNIKAALMHETIDGLSIGYMLKKDDYTPSGDTSNGRIIKSVSRLVEISLVTFPADPFARVDSKSEIEQLETVRDFERFLRDSGNFSKSTSNLLIAKAKTIFGQGEPVKKSVEIDKLLAKLAAINSKLGA